jgi:hypothetical protein
MQVTMFQTLSIAFFALAIIHVFLTDRFQQKAKATRGGLHPLYALFGNTTLIFGIWLIPTIISLYFLEGSERIEELFLSINYREPFAYFVLITIATVRPMIQLFHSFMQAINTRLGNGVSWCWATPLVLAALLGGIFSPIAIMALLCLYYSHFFFSLKPSRHLTYYTFAALLIISSASATIVPLNFNFFFQVMDPPMSHLEVFYLFGWKALVAVIALIGMGMTLFKKEFQRLQKAAVNIQHKKGPITLRHLFYLLLFLLASFGSGNAYILLMAIAITVIVHKAFYREKGKEGELKLYLPLTIAFFTGTLEIFARLQSFWAAPLLSDSGETQTFFWTYLLTGLNEHIPLEAFQISQNISLIAVVAGGGLTLIAKSSNIVAKKILKHHFPSEVISPFRHLAYAIPLTLLFALIVYLLGRIF